MTTDKRKVLVVDDSPTVRRLVELVLSQNNYEVISAEDGERGLELAKEHVPDVVLVDFVMPRMNGHMFCKALREDAALENIPIILISSKSEVVGQAFEESFGIVHYFTKPFEPDDLIAKIGEVLSLPIGDNSEKDSGAQSATSAPETSTKTTGVLTDMDQLLDSINDRFDKVVRNYFQKDFPVLMKNVMADTLRETGLIKHQTLIMTGDLTRMSLPEVLCFCAVTRQNGRLSIFSDDTFAEIFIQDGRFVFATASQKGKHKFLTDLICSDNRFKCDTKSLTKIVEEARNTNIPVGRALVEQGVISDSDLMYYLQRHAQDALNTGLHTKQGNFFLEKDELPFNLEDIKFRIPMFEVLLEGVRSLELSAPFDDDNLIVTRMPQCAVAAQDGLLHEDEQSLMLQLDGARTLGVVCAESALDEAVVRKACQVLYQSGLATIA
ncbi:MAG: response regulator [Desulfuromonas sp.]|nr:response regulator [Desulfuromonas sp.]